MDSRHAIQHFVLVQTRQHRTSFMATEPSRRHCRLQRNRGIDPPCRATFTVLDMALTAAAARRETELWRESGASVIKEKVAANPRDAGLEIV